MLVLNLTLFARAEETTGRSADTNSLLDGAAPYTYPPEAALKPRQLARP